MTVYLNNEPVEVEQNVSVASLLDLKGMSELDGIAVAVNNTVVSKTNWENTILNENDKLMIITATAGG